MKIIAIAAVSQNGVIGNEGALPWHLPEDMRFFREATRNQIVVMGRKTYESLGKALPHRENYVITRDRLLQLKDAKVSHDLSLTLKMIRENETQGRECFVIGGAEIYELSREFLDEIWLTQISKQVQGDVVFPRFSEGELKDPLFRLEKRELGKEVSKETGEYFFCVYTRLKK